LLAISIYTLVLAALFAERRHHERALEDSNNRLKGTNHRLQLALGGAELGVWSVDTATGRFESDARIGHIHGYAPDALPNTFEAARRFIHPGDLPALDAAFSAAKRTGGSCNVEYRLAPTGGPNLCRERWVATEGTVVRDADGQPVQLLGVARDITERKQSERVLAERNLQLALAGKAGRVGSFAYDIDTERMQISAGYAAIHGLPDGTKEVARSQCLASLHPEDAERPHLARGKAFRERRSEYSEEYRVIRPGGEVRWIEARCFISYDSEGRPQRILGVSIDNTDRKQAEDRLAERNAQFDLAQNAARVGTYTYDNISKTMQLSEACAAIFGLPQSVTEITSDDWRSRVHPDDLPRLDAGRRHAFKKRQPELVGEFRSVRPSGEMRWIEARAITSYDGGGRACRMVGVYIDITERRQAEDHKSLLIAELDHRVKNTLACVAALAHSTRDTTESMDDFVRVLDGRIQSLANTHSLLSRNRWQGVSIAELVREELAPCMKDGNTLIDGPDTILAAEATQPVSMVLHELATNAAKYGALSNSHGRVSVFWRKHCNGEARSKLVLEWIEAGGPPVIVPNHSGYGTSVIRELIPYELGGTVDYELAGGGVWCRVEIPAKWVNSTQTH
jgi:PAS domain S-box-containing protein